MLFLAINVNADSTFKKPFPVCSNIQSYMAYEISAMVNERCDAKGVSIKIKNLHNYFNSLLSTNEASPFECSLTCLTIALTNDMNLKDCVNNLIVEPFTRCSSF